MFSLNALFFSEQSFKLLISLFTLLRLKRNLLENHLDALALSRLGQGNHFLLPFINRAL
jgi:hypothetical protein